MIRAVTIAQQKNPITEANQLPKRLMHAGTKKEQDGGGGVL
jgi:hypothetical protein